jgi:hypothetical protein
MLGGLDQINNPPEFLKEKARRNRNMFRACVNKCDRPRTAASAASIEILNSSANIRVRLLSPKQI